MRNGSRLALLALVLAATAPGCALEELTSATVRSARFAERTSLNAARAAVRVAKGGVEMAARPFRKPEGETAPKTAVTVDGARATRTDTNVAQSTRTRGDDHLARASAEIDDEPHQRRTSRKRLEADADEEAPPRRSSNARTADTEDADEAGAPIPQPDKTKASEEVGMSSTTRSKARRAPERDPKAERAEDEAVTEPASLKEKPRARTASSAPADDDTIVIK